MRQFLLSILAMGVVALMGAMAFASCTTPPGATGGTWPTATKVYSLELYAAADNAAARETAVAQETRTALQAVAKATSDALALEQQATRASQDAQATAEAQSAMATRQAYDTEMTRTAMDAQATATQDARLAQATAESRNATATMDARISAQATANAFATSIALTSTLRAVAVDATKTSVQATATAVSLQADKEATRQGVNAVLKYGLVVLGLGALGYIGWRFLPVALDRARVVRRRPDEGEPFILLEKTDADGNKRVALPLRTLGAMLDTGVSFPLLPDLVNKSTMRQQTANLAQAAQVGKVTQARSWPKAKVPMAVIKRQAVARPGALPADPGQWNVEQDGEQAANWPAQVNLLDVFADKTPSLNHLVIGAHPTSNGQMAVVGASLHKLMHVLCCGASGWGKSTFLSAFVWQLAGASEPVAVVAIDISGSEFNLLHQWDKLQFPVARCDRDAIAALSAVADELRRRRELFEAYPMARNLARYNRQSGDDLEPWVILLDEGASLLARKDTGDTLRDAIQTSRQYGIYCLLASVSVNFMVLPTEVRDQFSTRLAFRLPKSSMRVVLDESPKDVLPRPGRAWARLAGREMVQVQCPIVSESDLVRALGTGGPVAELPDVAESSKSNGREARVIELLEGDKALSDTAIARIAYGHGTTHYIEKVRAVKARWEQQQQNDNNNAGMRV